MMAPMSELARPPAANQIWITRGHLAALAVATVAIAVLAFFVGLEIGRRGAGAVDEAAHVQVSFLPDETDEQALEGLLRQVEQAQAATPDAAPEEVTFNKALESDAPSAATPVPEPPPSAVLSQVDAGQAPPPPAEAAPGALAPDGGWAVQVASYPDVDQADAHVARLQEQKLQAYRVSALVSGQTWYRVRIGGFHTRDAAAEARDRIGQDLGLPDLLVTAAP